MPQLIGIRESDNVTTGAAAVVIARQDGTAHGDEETDAGAVGVVKRRNGDDSGKGPYERVTISDRDVVTVPPLDRIGERDDVTAGTAAIATARQDGTAHGDNSADSVGAVKARDVDDGDKRRHKRITVGDGDVNAGAAAVVTLRQSGIAHGNFDAVAAAKLGGGDSSG